MSLVCDSIGHHVKPLKVPLRAYKGDVFLDLPGQPVFGERSHELIETDGVFRGFEQEYILSCSRCEQELAVMRVDVVGLNEYQEEE